MLPITAAGSMPGTDPRTTTLFVRDRLAVDGGVPFLVELPARGPGAGLVGRALVLLAATWAAWGADTGPTGWELTGTSSAALRRGRSWLSEDLDVTEEAYTGWSGPLRVAVGGPYTLAASVERRGKLLLADPGAVADLIDTWVQAVGDHADDVARRVPGAAVQIVVDEPSLPAVLAGIVRTASGLSNYAPLEESVVRDGLAAIATRLPGVELHCCASRPPTELAKQAGFAGVHIDTGLVPDEEVIGTAVEAGLRVWLGLLSAKSGIAATVANVREVDARLQIPHLADHIGLAPPCGLADTSMAEVSELLDRAFETRNRLLEAWA